MRITSLQNERVKAAAKLRDRKGRDEQRRIIIDGLREIGRALAAGVAVTELFYDETLTSSGEIARLVQQTERGGGESLGCPPAVLAKLAFGDRHEGAVAVATPPDSSLVAFRSRQPPLARPLLAILEGIEKPGNIGAILRTADAAGLSGLIVADGGTDLFNPNAIRASVGAIFTVPVAATTGVETLAWLRGQQVQIVTTQVDATVDYTAVDFTRPTAIVLGSEALGLSAQWRGDDIQPIRLPMCGQVDSLNVSVTAAVLFYEALRQRQNTSRGRKV